MAIALVTVGAISSSGSAAALAPALPASRVNNNILISVVSANATGKTFALGGAGWTAGDSINTGNLSAAWAWRLVDGTETSPSWSWTGAAACESLVTQFSGNQTTTPIGNINKATANSSTTSTIASITTTANNSVILGTILISANAAVGLPVGWTNVSSNAGGGGSEHQFYGFVGTSGTQSEPVSQAIATSDWASFGVEIVGPGGTAINLNVRQTQVVQQVLQRYSSTAAARQTQVVQQVLRSVSTFATTVGNADGAATAVSITGLITGHADGFATVQAFPPSHGNADGRADVVGYSRNVAKAAGQADGFANVSGLSGQPATGHADGFANVFSTKTKITRGSAALLAGI